MPALRVFISYGPDSLDHVQQVVHLARRLRDSGFDTTLALPLDDEPRHGWQRWTEHELDTADRVLVVCSPALHRVFHGQDPAFEGALLMAQWRERPRLAQKCVPVLLPGADAGCIPEPLRDQVAVTVDAEGSLAALIDHLRWDLPPPDHGLAMASSPPVRSPAPALPHIDLSVRSSQARRGGSAFGLLGAVLAAPFVAVGAAIDALRRMADRPASPAPAQPASAEPLLFGISAPPVAHAGDEFVLAFMAYVASMRAQTLQQVQALVGPSHRPLLDLAPDGAAVWRTGTPFTVRVSGRAFDVDPPERSFEWNGSRHVASFAVRARPGSGGAAVLTVLVQVAGVAVGCFPVQVQVQPADAPPAPVQPPREAEWAAPRSAFASYASADAGEVAGRLATLARWAPGLDIFQDCLDLKPNEAFKPQLESQIAARDAFLLFWSRRAADSRWVRWELSTALARKSAQAILPMPLEDPALAPPPPELADLHFRDRYTLAGYALKAIDEARRQGAAR